MISAFLGILKTFFKNPGSYPDAADFQHLINFSLFLGSRHPVAILTVLTVLSV